MKGFVAVLWLELRQWRLLLAGSLAIGLIPFLVPLVLPKHGYPDAIEATAIALFVGTVVMLTLILGATLFASDLAERRLGFLFSRPISGLAIWSGRYLAALLLIVVGGGLVLAPAAIRLGGLPDVVLGKAWHSIPDFLSAGIISSAPFTVQVFFFFWSPLVMGGVALIGLLALAHAAVLAWRGRSLWLVVDLVVLMLGVGWLYLVLGSLVVSQATMPAAMASVALCIYGAVALTVAWLVQILRARTRLHTGQKLHSRVFWSLMVPALVALGIFHQWTLAPGPEAIELLTGTHTGERFFVYSGLVQRRPGYAPRFLTDLESGDTWNLSTLTFRDGTSGAKSRDGFEVPVEAYRVLMESGNRWWWWRTSSLVSPDAWGVRRESRTAVSRDGTLTAFATRDRLFVTSTSGSTGIRASIPFDGRLWERHEITFLDDGTVRVAESDFAKRDEAEGRDHTSRVRVRDFDIGAGKVRDVLDFEVTGHWYRGFPSPDRRRLLLAARTSLLVLDIDSGETTELPFEEADFNYGAALLESGDVVVASVREKEAVLSLIRKGSPELIEIPLPEPPSGLPPGITFAGQPSPELLLFAERSESITSEEVPPPIQCQDLYSWQTSVLDLESGSVRRVGNDLRPIGASDVQVGSFGSRLMQRGTGEIGLWDPGTDELKPLFESG